MKAPSAGKMAAKRAGSKMGRPSSRLSRAVSRLPAEVVTTKSISSTALGACTSTSTHVVGSPSQGEWEQPARANRKTAAFRAAFIGR